MWDFRAKEWVGMQTRRPDEYRTRGIGRSYGKESGQMTDEWNECSEIRVPDDTEWDDWLGESDLIKASGNWRDDRDSQTANLSAVK